MHERSNNSNHGNRHTQQSKHLQTNAHYFTWLRVVIKHAKLAEAADFPFQTNSIETDLRNFQQQHNPENLEGMPLVAMVVLWHFRPIALQLFAESRDASYPARILLYYFQCIYLKVADSNLSLRSRLKTRGSNNVAPKIKTKQDFNSLDSTVKDTLKSLCNEAMTMFEECIDKENPWIPLDEDAIQEIQDLFNTEAEDKAPATKAQSFMMSPIPKPQEEFPISPRQMSVCPEMHWQSVFEPSERANDHGCHSCEREPIRYAVEPSEGPVDLTHSSHFLDFAEIDRPKPSSESIHRAPAGATEPKSQESNHSAGLSGHFSEVTL